MEQFDCTVRDEPGHFVIAAIAAFDPRLMNKAIWPESGVHEDGRRSAFVQVTFTVNGVEMPFRATLEDIYKRMQARIDEQVLEKAISLISIAGFDEVREAIDEANWKIKDHFETALKKLI